MREIWRQGDLSVDAILQAGDFAHIREDWERLATHPAVDPDAYMSRLQDDGDVVGPAVLVARRAGVVVGLLVGRIEAKRLDFLVGHLPVYRVRARVLAGFEHGVIGADDPDVAAGYVGSIMHLLRRRTADFAHLACVDISAPIRRWARELPSRFCRSWVTDTDARWSLAIPATFEEFVASRSRNTRANIRRHEKQLLHAHPDVRVAVFGRGAAETLDALADVMEVCRKTYQFKLGLAPLCHPLARKTWDEGCRRARLVLALVYIGGRPVAFSYAHIYKSIALFMTPGYDPAFASLHVGEYSLLKLVQGLIAERDVAILDYGQGYLQYKESFGTSCTQEGHVRLFAPTPKGIYLNIVRTVTAGASSFLLAAAERLRVKNALKRILRRLR